MSGGLTNATKLNAADSATVTVNKHRQKGHRTIIFLRVFSILLFQHVQTHEITNKTSLPRETIALPERCGLWFETATSAYTVCIGVATSQREALGASDPRPKMDKTAKG